ncbi:phosphate regulon transcriptional regulatory protein PhoB [Acinetobacter baumannii]|uniref:winged helix-turn-helix domain-containing protein n=1 Tax=Serratia ureilytica TaxID=300181 RepID=UPI000B8E7257|nr:winged helix-turn-helix domain-containing protein [Serratia ureilytica]MEB5996066.1 winged helix-turn-helix domain-containing protein [Serratia ureilytica]SVK51012.1 phosphate regulon transcriptional regulatory protein PhoB [Acinetobacter baumannii]
MIFIINEDILFNEDEGTLSHIDNASNKIALLKPTSRLLSLFVRNNEKLLLRERLLNDVWVEHGLKASNNNLNNYVSSLRKSLAQFGIEDIIVTYPRQGFKFSAASIQNTNMNEEEIIVYGDNEQNIASAPPVRQPLEFRHALQRLIMIAAACLVPFAAIVLYQNSTRISIYPLGNEQHCQIYTMRLGSGELRSIKQAIRQAGFNCQYPADVYYYDNIRSEGAENNEQWITYCPRAGNSPCINNYIDNRQP